MMNQTIYRELHALKRLYKIMRFKHFFTINQWSICSIIDELFIMQPLHATPSCVFKSIKNCLNFL